MHAPSAENAVSSQNGSSATATESPQLIRITRICAELFAAKGYNAVGIAEISDAVGLGRGALYHHINSKEELLYRIVIKYIRELVTEGHQIVKNEIDPSRCVKKLSRHLIGTIAGQLFELTVCFREVNALTGERHRTVSKLHSEYQAIWSKVISDGVKEGTFRPLPPVALKGILGMYFHSFLWLKPSGLNRPDEVADIFTDLVLRGIVR
jgi:AcrR family transcriptional regulator